MHPVERYQTAVLLVAVAVGVAVGQIPAVAGVADAVVLPALLATLFVTFLGVALGTVRGALGNRRFLAVALGFNFLWTPAFAAGLGAVFLADHPELWVGLLLLLVTPCTDWYLVFTDLADGDVPLATSLLPFNLLLQIALIPVYLALFAGTVVAVPVRPLVESVVFVLVVPLVAAAVARRLLVRRRGTSWFARFTDQLGPVQVFTLAVAVGAMFASQGEALVRQPEVVLLLAAPLLVFFVGTFLLGRLVVRVADFDRAAGATFTCTTLARNSPTALAVAVAAFPDRPLIALALVVGPLLELPLLGLATRVLRALPGPDAPHDEESAPGDSL